MSGQKVNLLQGRVRIEDWPLSEKRDVFGGCLRGAFPPEPDPELLRLLADLDSSGRKGGSSNRSA